jgi:LL-H family phage holin
MDNRLFELILALIPVLGTILTAYIIPLIKEWLGNEKLAKYEAWVDMAVRAAEMMFTENGMGESKKAYVIGFLTEMFNKNKVVITEKQMEILIESAVKQMKLEEK